MPKKKSFPHLIKTRGPAVVVYHSVDDLEKSGRKAFFSGKNRGAGALLNIEPRVFSDQLKFFEKHFHIISGRTLLKAALEGKAVKKALVITFDDGYRSVYENAVPLLRRRNIPATVFVTRDYADGIRISGSARRNLFRNKPSLKKMNDAEISKKYRLYMNRRELDSLDKRLFTIGNHGKSHFRLSSLAKEEIMSQINDPLAAIRELSGMRRPFFAFPYGTKGSYNRFAVSAALKNHSAVFTAYGSANSVHPDLKDIRRVPMPNIAICNFGRSGV